MTPLGLSTQGTQARSQSASCRHTEERSEAEDEDERSSDGDGLNHTPGGRTEQLGTQALVLHCGGLGGSLHLGELGGLLGHDWHGVELADGPDGGGGLVHAAREALAQQGGLWVRDAVIEGLLGLVFSQARRGLPGSFCRGDIEIRTGK